MKSIPFLLIALMVLVLLLDVKKGILAGLVVRPFIDAFWEFKYQVSGIRPTELISALFPILVFGRLLTHPGNPFRESPLSLLWILYMSYQLFSAVLILTAGGGLWSSADFILRIFNGFVAYFMLQEFFSRREDFRKLLLALWIASLAPLAMSVYMNILGGTLRTEATAGGLVRNIGLYHDAFTIRLYSFQALIAVLLYWHYFSAPSRIFTKMMMIGILGLPTLTIFKVHSKAGYLISTIWVLLYSLFNPKAIAWVLLVLLPFFLWNPGSSWEKIKFTFTGEIAAMEGKAEVEATLAGRIPGWRSHWEKWVNSPLHLKLIGDSGSHTGVHNDFLRALFATGVLGFSLYALLLGGIGIRAMRLFWQNRTPLNLVAVMLFAMWMVDALGLVPGAYPSYQWFAWGFVGLAFRGVRETDPPPVQDRP